jgi:uncharacterized membrane protein
MALTAAKSCISAESGIPPVANSAELLSWAWTRFQLIPAGQAGRCHGRMNVHAAHLEHHHSDMKLVHLLNAILLLGLLGVSALVYPDLPERIPLHFAADGQPDRWGDTTFLSWMLLPLAAVAVVLLTYGCAWYVATRPKNINMPDRKKLMQLPAHLQQWVVSAVVDMVHIVTLTVLTMFCAIQYAAWESAHTGSASSVIHVALVLGLVGMPFLAIATFVVTQRRMNRAWTKWQAEV